MVFGFSLHAHDFAGRYARNVEFHFALAATHTRFARLFGDGNVRKHADPHLAALLDEAAERLRRLGTCVHSFGIDILKQKLKTRNEIFSADA